MATNLNQGKKQEKDKRQQKLSKQDIGEPIGFRHIQHIGWNPNTGFDLENVNPNLVQFFDAAGVSNEELTDQDTRTFIYDFINKHGGIEAAVQEMKRPPPSTPLVLSVSSLPPPLPNHSSVVSQPPPPPSRSPHKLTTAPSILAMPTGALPPPPPLPSMPTQAAPPPPPPPMSAPGVPPPPPLPSLSSMSSAVPDTRSALLDQIRKGKAFHHFEPDSDSVKSNTSSDDPRNALMSQIREGVCLRSVEINAAKADPNSNPAESGGLAGSLARALQERSRAIGRTDESDSESGSEDDQWED